MNERLSIQDLIDALANKHNLPRKEAEVFVREFFLLIEQALESEQFVKVKGLGTFKLVDVESRESVSVSTGERFEIKGHTKLSFIPDAALRDTINKPFSHFETVVLNENTVLEDTLVEEETEELEETEEVELTEPTVTEPAEEVQELVVSQEATASEETFVLEEMTASEEMTAPKEVTVPEEMTTPEEVTVSEEVTSLENHVSSEKEIVCDPSVEPEVVRPAEPVVSSKEEKSYTGLLIGLVVSVLLLCGGLIGYSYYLDSIPYVAEQREDLADEDEPVLESEENGLDSLEIATTENQLPMEEVPLSAKKALSSEKAPATSSVTTPVTAPVTAQATASASVSKPAKAPVASQPKQVYSESVNYAIVGTKAKHTVKAGETLMRVSLRYYGTKALWTYIVKHNPKVIKNPDNVPYGTVIAIPELKQK